MRKPLALFLAIASAALLALLGVISPWAAAGPSPAVMTSSYAYDAPYYDAPGSGSAQERGPPSVVVTNTTYDAADGWSRGSWARSDVHAAPAITTYACPAMLGPVARATTTSARHAVVADGEFSSVQPAQDAAETGVMDLPASTTWGRADSLTDHFARHGADFGATTEVEYAQRASGFFQRGLQDGLPTKINPKDGSIRIYDPQSNTFGAYNANGTTRTFYKPDPAQHGYATNWDYWLAQPGYAP
jgi:hypothetical protein